MANVNVLDVIADVAQIARKAPNGTLIGAYIRAARKFCRESRWYRSTLVGQNVADKQVYSLGSDPYVEIVGLAAVTGAYLTGAPRTWPLTPSDSKGWNPDANATRPTRYCYVPEAQLALYPTPDAAYTITSTLVLQPKAGAVVVPEELLVKWDQVLQAGALAYLHSIPGMPWSDAQQAMLKMREFQAGINNARADEQRGYQAGTVVAKRRPFIVGRV